jgi:hypothetical protein
LNLFYSPDFYVSVPRFIGMIGYHNMTFAPLLKSWIFYEFAQLKQRIELGSGKLKFNHFYTVEPVFAMISGKYNFTAVKLTYRFKLHIFQVRTFRKVLL